MSVQVYSTSSVLAIGTILYTDVNLSNPAPDGIYSNGVDAFYVTGGLGQVTSITASACTQPPTPTTTTTTTTTTQPPTPTTTTTTTTTTQPPTPTTTTTTTTTTIQVNQFCLGYDPSDPLLACQDYLSCT